MSELTLPEQGDERFLSQEERLFLRRLLKFSEEYPDELGTYIKEFLKVNPPQVTATQVRGSRGAPRYLVRKTDVVAADSINETTIYQTTIPAKAVSKTGQLKVLVFWNASCADASNFAVIRVKLGSTSLFDDDLFISTASELDGTQRRGCLEATITNIGSYSEQLAIGRLMQNGESLSTPTVTRNAVGSSSVDLSQDQELTITVDWNASGTQNYDSAYFAVEIFNPVGAAA